jgi:Delta14-sterol reductase
MVASPNKATASTLSSSSSFAWEFGGPIGALATTMILPIVVLSLLHWSSIGHVDNVLFPTDFPSTMIDRQPHDHTSSSNSVLLSMVNVPRLFWKRLIVNNVLCPGCHEYFSNDTENVTSTTLWNALVVIVGWGLYQVILERVLPADIVYGSPIHQHPQKICLPYRINGHLAFWITFLITQIGWPIWDDNTTSIMPLQFTSAPLYRLYSFTPELALITIVFCFLFSLYLYGTSFINTKDKILAIGGTSGNPWYDFFMGRELNPRPVTMNGTFDYKEFCELRPGLMGWMILNMSCAQQQFRQLGYVSGSMMLINLFQGIYVWDALYQERAILTTMDITTDGFGFMLVFGDLAWVPFTYSIQARYLVNHDPNLSIAALTTILAIHLLGYIIFRGANGQKDIFRRNPNDPAVSHLTYLQTKRGTKLITSGWWGMARKINYTGDYLMGLTWCLLCGFNSIVPYFYAIYFLILLIHRSTRDDHMCQTKYGADWNLYKEMVPYRFIPGII